MEKSIAEIEDRIKIEYENLSKKAWDMVENKFVKISSVKDSIISKMREGMNKCYENYINNNIDKSDYDSFIKELQEIIRLCDKTLQTCKFQDLIDDKCIFGNSKIICCLNWYGLNSSKFVSGNTFNNYSVAKTQEIFDGEFECKIEIIKINLQRISWTWCFSAGVIKTSCVNEESYQNDSVVFLSYGYLAEPYSSNGYYKQIFKSHWKAGDVILIKRDQNYNVYFGMNDETSYSLAGEVRVILGFSQALSDDVFELKELNEK
jgi:hypothetical protein